MPSVCEDLHICTPLAWWLSLHKHQHKKDRSMRTSFKKKILFKKITLLRPSLHNIEFIQFKFSIFRKFTELCHHHHRSALEHSHKPIKIPRARYH